MFDLLKKTPLYLQIIIGIVAGVLVAVLASSLQMSELVIKWIAPFGKIFIRLLKLIAVPLVIFSIIKGVSSLSDATSLGRLAAKTISLYLITTLIAIGVGMVCSYLINPGNYTEKNIRTKNRLHYELWVQESADRTLIDDKNYLEDPKNQQLLQELQPNEALPATSNAKYQKVLSNKSKATDTGPLNPLVEIFPDNMFAAMGNNKLLLQVIFVSVFIGVCLLLIDPEKAKPMNDLVNSANEVFLKMVNIIMRGAPFFVFALMAGEIAKTAGDDPNQVSTMLKPLLSYSLVVISGLLTMTLIYPLLVHILVKKISYLKFLKAINPAQILAFSTSSSAATLPVTMNCVENNLGVSKKISSFVLPIGATVNMDGTSLYQTVAILFMAQSAFVDFNASHLFTIAITTVLASIGTAAVPGAGLVMILVVLETLGLPAYWLAGILAVDRILDMFRTVVNITGDTAVTTIIASQENEINTLS